MNALYECSVTHCRLQPLRHAFTYRVFMLACDLDDIPALARRIPWLGHNRFNLFSIADRDHVDLGLSGGIRPNLARWLTEHGLRCPPDARIQLLTFPRVLGYGFYPVSFYFICSAAGHPLITVAEVRNTYHEMKLYALEGITPDGLWHRRVAKNFYVSPFSHPGMDFHFRIGLPARQWRVNIDTLAPSGRVLLTAMRGRQQQLSAGRLLWYAIKYPALSLQIIGLIHWQAFRLWLRRVPFFPKARHPEAQLDVLRPHATLQQHPP